MTISVHNSSGMYGQKDAVPSSTNLSGVSLSEVPLRPIMAADKEHQREDLERVGLKKGIITIMSLMIGSGIFASAGNIHKMVGSIGIALFIWVITGCVALCGALCYAELGTAIPGSGGESQYLTRGFGAWAAFLFEWAAIVLIRPASVSLLTEAFSKHAVMAFIAATDRPWISSVQELTLHYRWACKGTAIAACLLVTAMASVSYKTSDRIQGVLTYGKILSLVVIIGAGLSFAVFGSGDAAVLGKNFASPFATQGDTWSLLTGVAMAMNHGLWAFDGWNNLNLIAGRVVNPARTLPMSIWSSILIVLSLYSMVLLGYYSVVPAAIVMQSETIGLEFGQRLLGRWGAVVMSSFVMASTFGAALSSMMTSSEIIIQSVNKGCLPRIFGQINASTGTAIWAYCMQGLLSVFIVFLADYEGLVTICTFPTWIFYIGTVATLLLLRIREPGLPRPYRVWLSTPIVFLIGCILLVITTIIEDKWYVAFSVFLSALGLPVYWLINRGNAKK